MLRLYNRYQRKHYTLSRSLLQSSKPIIVSANTLIVIKASMNMRVLEINDMAVIKTIAVVTALNLTNITSGQM